MSEPSRRSKYQVVFEDEDYNAFDLAYSIASVSASYWEAKIDANVSTAFATLPSVEQCLRPSSDVAFCEAMSVRGETSKISASIGSCNIYSET